MLTFDFNPFPILETERLILRKPNITDVDEMYLYRSNKELMQYIPHRFAHNRAEVEEMITILHQLVADKESINWAITQKGDDTIIGTVGFVRFIKNHHRAEIGYMLHTPYHGKKITDEAIQAVIEYGFTTLKLHSIEAVVNTANIASKKILERNTFTNDALFKDYLFLADTFVDANVFSIVNNK